MAVHDENSKKEIMETMKKRLLTGLLAGTMAVSALTGCGVQTSAPETSGTSVSQEDAVTDTAGAVQQKDSADLHPESESAGALEMTEYEYGLLKDAYETTMTRTGEEETFGQEEYIKYGSYEPLTVTITHILNNKSGKLRGLLRQH